MWHLKKCIINPNFLLNVNMWKEVIYPLKNTFCRRAFFFLASYPTLLNFDHLLESVDLAPVFSGFISRMRFSWVRDACQKKRENVGIFPKSGTPPPPCLGMTRLFEKKNHGLFCILGGSPMLKTVKTGIGIRVDPPPLFFQNSHIFPFFFGGSFPYYGWTVTENVT